MSLYNRALRAFAATGAMALGSAGMSLLGGTAHPPELIFVWLTIAVIADRLEAL